MTARITAYAYVHAGAVAYGATFPRFDTVASLGVIEQATPGTTTWARPTTPTPLYLPGGSDQLAAWQTSLNAHAPAGQYAVTYSPTTKRITIASTNGTAFRPTFHSNGAEWTGFTGSLVGWATSWTATAAPAAVAELIGVTVEPAEDWARVDLKRYRHGRAAAIVWGNHQAHQVTLYLKRDDLRALDPGYLVTGRVVIQQGADSTAYSATNPGGVVDGFVLAASDVTEDGDLGDVWTINLVVGVLRV